MGDINPNLFDLIAPIVEEVIPVQWGEAPPYDREQIKHGRYQGVWVIGIYPDRIALRSTFAKIYAAEPDFIDHMRKELVDIKLHIDSSTQREQEFKETLDAARRDIHGRV